MIIKVNVRLDLPTALHTNNIGSILHGVLIEKLPSETAEFLHQSSAYSPLKQRITFQREAVDWEIVCLTVELGEQIEAIFQNRQTIFLKRHDTVVPILAYKIEKYTIDQLIKSIFTKEQLPRIVTLKLSTPMSFKSNGQYDIFPDVKKFFRSIMRTFDAFFSEYQMYDQVTLTYLTEQVKIINYQLRSTKYHLEGVRIPSFSGQMTFRLNGSLAILQLAWFLLIFGELSGVGIKTSLGMGKYQIFK